ncbi:hypothetical protein VTP01DRAFT_1345 [Rhizomucor pusillus]|uniref:uncharacterized protein n=1 Tax=Rhizomucor pusillus TaxID=4840 RepID=UPI003743065D
MEQQHLESRNKLYSKLKRGAFMGGAVGVCIGLAVGTTSLFGRPSGSSSSSSRTYATTVSKYMASSVLSIAAWMSLRGLLFREPFPALLYQSGASHANRPLEHLRLMNNAPASISNMYQPPSMRTFVHSRCN